MLSKKDIEELATGAVKRYFNTCNLVSPQIQENDKTPDWDGELVSIRPRACFFPLFSFLPLWLHYNLNPLCVQY